MQKNIVYLVGGADFHPAEAQARLVAEWLGPGYNHQLREGVAAFEALNDCDLLVLMGSLWSGMEGDAAYHPMQDNHKQAFERYLALGRPMLVHHGVICSYDDWPRFGELMGFTWVWDTSGHSPLGDHALRVLPTGHPIVSEVTDYTIHDELYYDIRVTPGLKAEVHAEADWDGRRLPMVMTAEGGRIEGAGRVVFLANGHDLRAFQCPALEQLWLNAINWLLETQ